MSNLTPTEERLLENPKCWEKQCNDLLDEIQARLSKNMTDHMPEKPPFESEAWEGYMHDAKMAEEVRLELLVQVEDLRSAVKEIFADPYYDEDGLPLIDEDGLYLGERYASSYGLHIGTWAEDMASLEQSVIELRYEVNDFIDDLTQLNYEDS